MLSHLQNTSQRKYDKIDNDYEVDDNGNDDENGSGTQKPDDNNGSDYIDDDDGDSDNGSGTKPDDNDDDDINDSTTQKPDDDDDDDDSIDGSTTLKPDDIDYTDNTDDDDCIVDGDCGSYDADGECDYWYEEFDLQCLANQKKNETVSGAGTTGAHSKCAAGVVRTAPDCSDGGHLVGANPVKNFYQEAAFVVAINPKE